MKAQLLGAVAATMIAAGAYAGPLPSSWTSTGNAGTGSSNGDVTAPPEGGPGFFYVSTNGGESGVGALPGVGGAGSATTGSVTTTNTFTAAANDTLKFFFNYVTSDGAGYADYGWARLLTAAGDQVALLFTARTTPSGNTSPGFGMPEPEATLNPVGAPINPGAPIWDMLGGSSGTCYISVGNGCGYTGWVQSTYDIAQAGDYKLQFGVVNWSDTAFQSGMAFAGLKIGDVIITPPPSSVPLPASVWLLMGGLGVLAAHRRRKAA